MHDPTDPELCRKITENPYFQSLVEKQVQTKFHEQLDQTRKVLLPALVILVLAGSFYSFTSIKDLNDKKRELETKVDAKIKELNADIEDVRNKSREATPMIEELSRKSEAAKTQFELYDRTATAIIGTFKDTTSQSLASIQRTHDELAGEIRQFEQTQSKAAAQASDLLNRLGNEGTKLEVTQQKLEEVAEKANGEVKQADSIRGQLETEQQRFRQANADLLKATQIQYLLMHSNNDRDMTMYAQASGAAATGGEPPLIEYRLKFQTHRVRPGRHVTISVVQGSGGKPGSSRDYPLADGAREQIDGTPFDYEVPFIYRATVVAHHFVVIRVAPHATVMP